MIACTLWRSIRKFAAAVTSAALIVFGVQAQLSPTGKIDGFPPFLHYIFAGFCAIAAIADVRMIRRGGATGPARIARHLWRMCAALLLASFSFFIGQQKVMPLFMRGSPLFFVPELAILAAMVFWLVYVGVSRRYKSAPLAGTLATAATTEPPR